MSLVVNYFYAVSGRVLLAGKLVILRLYLK